MSIVHAAQAPAPAPTGLSPTAALIGAGAVLLVAPITTGVQVYIARRNWTEQAKQAKEEREDQRRRDAEQREDQRQRDREAWEREDRHRFAAEKRTVYGDVLNATSDFMQTISDCARDVFFNGNDLDHGQGIAARERFQNSRGALTLLGDDLVRKSCDATYNVLVTTFFAMSTSREGDLAERQERYTAMIGECDKAIRHLAVSMRDDLGIPNLHGSTVLDRL